MVPASQSLAVLPGIIPWLVIRFKLKLRRVKEAIRLGYPPFRRRSTIGVRLLIRTFGELLSSWERIVRCHCFRPATLAKVVVPAGLPFRRENVTFRLMAMSLFIGHLFLA